jgi:hypothetical protein
MPFHSVNPMDPVLMRPADGTTVTSVPLTDTKQPQHVYRILAPNGTTRGDFSSLTQLGVLLHGSPVQ